MITIHRNGKDCFISFELFIPYLGERIFEFKWETTQEYISGLLSNELKDRLYNRVESIRREAYNKGWKDAKSHKAIKETWFDGSI